MENHLALLKELVNIDSGTGDTEGLHRIAELLKDKAENIGCQFKSLRATDGSIHYLAGRGEGERVLLVAHLDTVFPKGTAEKRPFAVEGEIARGPGVSDCKSGVVTIMGALAELATNWPSLRIECFFNSDEEISSPGSRQFLADLARNAKAVLVVEPAEGENVTIARKGIGRFDLKVFGKAAHSGSNYQDGRHAILELAHKIIAIQNLSDFEAGVTLNVGTVSGGVRPNIIPDFAAAEIDLRMVKRGQETEIIKKLKQVASIAVVPGTSAKLTGGITRPPMEATEQAEWLYRIVKQAGHNLGMELGAVHSGGGSDANLAAMEDVPTLDGMGPIGGGHHSEDEYLEIPSLERRIKLLAETLRILPEY